ncbi:MAG: hypothetical protein HW416_86 [Chloroflexi bacterium]|nr:hypothetical protein [Chloroflexota bacterium]
MFYVPLSGQRFLITVRVFISAKPNERAAGV